MYAKICLGILCCIFSSGAMARTIALDITLDIYEMSGFEKYSKDIIADGWSVEADEYGDAVYRLQVNLQESEIPFAKWLGGGFVKIDKDFVLSMGISVADADASVLASFELPRTNGQISPLSSLTVKCSGGDHAGGTWYFYGQTDIEVF